jgi:hypothetical protein
MKNIPAGSWRLYIDTWQSYQRNHASNATVRHDARE